MADKRGRVVRWEDAVAPLTIVYIVGAVVALAVWAVNV